MYKYVSPSSEGIKQMAGHVADGTCFARAMVNDQNLPILVSDDHCDPLLTSLMTSLTLFC